MAQPCVQSLIGLPVIAFLVGCSAATAPPPAGNSPAASAATSAVGDGRFDGDWVRTDTNGSGSFGGLGDTIEKAQLTSDGAALLAKSPQQFGPPGVLAAETRPHKVGEPYIVVDKPCQGGPNSEGSLGINPDSGAIHIIESKSQFVIALERGGARTIYTDGRTHPDPSRWTPTAAGHGIGHYEGGAFVADTVGLTAGRVPGSGLRTPETHLAERFEVSADGKHMTVSYSYSDPKIYSRNLSYQYTFDRLPADSYAIEEWCDASDPAERQSIVPPSQE